MSQPPSNNKSTYSSRKGKERSPSNLFNEDDDTDYNNMPPLEELSEEDNNEQPACGTMFAAPAATPIDQSRPLPVLTRSRSNSSAMACNSAAVRCRAFVEWMEGIAEERPRRNHPGHGVTTNPSGGTLSDARDQQNGGLAGSSTTPESISPGAPNSGCRNSSTQGMAPGSSSQQTPTGTNAATCRTESSHNLPSPTILGVQHPNSPALGTPEVHAPRPSHPATSPARIWLSKNAGILAGCRQLFMREADEIWRQFADGHLLTGRNFGEDNHDEYEEHSSQSDSHSVADDTFTDAGDNTPAVDDDVPGLNDDVPGLNDAVATVNSNTAALRNLSLDDDVSTTNSRNPSTNDNIAHATDTSPPAATSLAAANNNISALTGPGPQINGSTPANNSLSPSFGSTTTGPSMSSAPMPLHWYTGLSLNFYGGSPPGALSVSWGAGPAIAGTAAAGPNVAAVPPTTSDEAPREQTNAPRIWYAVARGRVRGIFETWATVEPLVVNYEGALFSDFDTMYDAQVWLMSNN